MKREEVGEGRRRGKTRRRDRSKEGEVGKGGEGKGGGVSKWEENGMNKSEGQNGGG